MYLNEILERQKNNNKVAIKHGDKKITYKDWYNCSVKLSNVISKAISDNTNNIALFLPNSIEYALAYFSILFSNRIIVPINTESKGLEIISTIEYCEIDLVITNLQHYDYLRECLAFYNYKILLLVIEDQSIHVINSKKSFIEKSYYIKNQRNEDDVAIMLHTSGTTSEPKRIMLTHKNLISNIESNIQSLKLNEDDKTLISMPMIFGYCNTAQFLTHVYLGASIVILNNMFFPKLFFQTVQDECITNFTGVPSMLLMLLEYRYTDKYDINSLKYICFGGGKMPVDKLEILIRKFSSIGFVQTYGQTEASPRITALMPEDSLRKIGSVGLPIPNVNLKIVNDKGESLPSGIIGEIIIHGDNIMKGYYKQDAITNDTIIDGWLYTGDLGYLDNEGYLYLTGRKRNIIISGGINIYPEEIEEVLMGHANVSEVCVISEEHYFLGEIPIAKIVLKDNCIIDDFRAYCAKKLSEYKIPKRFDFVTHLDKTYNGKIKRR